MGKHPNRADPLEQLRKAYSKKSERKTQIKQKGNDLYFDKDVRFSLKTQTAWQSTQTKKQFTLGSLWLFLEFHTGAISSKAEYAAKAIQLNQERINIADQKEIIDYFTGEVEQTNCIKNELKMALSQKNLKRDQPVGGFQQVDGEPSKKVKTQQQSLPHQLQVMEYLLNYERPVNSKSKCLRYMNRSFYGIIKNLFDCQKNYVEENKNTSKTKLTLRIASIVQRKRLPIIIVPKQTQMGNISLQNIEKYLTKSQYDQNAKLDNPEASKVQIEKELRGKRVTFEANSRPNLLSLSDLENVVAIFVQGKDSQFLEWPEKDHKKIFSKIPGFFMRTPGPLNNESREWRVKSFIVEKDKRQNDPQIVNSIWRDIQTYIFQKI